MAFVPDMETPDANPSDYEPDNYDNSDDTGLFGNTPESDQSDPAVVDQSGSGELPPEQLDQIAQTPGQPVQTAALPTSPQKSIDQAFKAGEATSAVQGAVGESLGTRQAAEADTLEGSAAQVRLDELEREDMQRRHDDALASADADLKKAQEAVKDFKYHDYWSDKSAGSKALAILFSAIGGGASTYAKQPNYALEEINRLEDRDFKQQQSKLLNQTKFAEWKKEGVKDLEGRVGREMAQLQLNQANRLKHLGDYAQAQYLRSGKTVEQAQSNVLSAKLYQQAAEKRADSMLSLYKVNLAAQNKRKGGVAGVNGDSLSKLAAYEATHPGDDPGLYREAGRLGIPGKQMMAAVQQVRASAEKRLAGEAKKSEDVEKRVVYDDTTKQPLGLAPTPRQTLAVGAEATAMSNYIDQLERAKAHIAKEGHIYNPLGDAALERKQIIGDVVAAGIKAKNLGVSEEFLKLDKQITGGTGVLLERSASPKQMQNLIDEAKKLRERRLRAVLRPLPETGEVIPEDKKTKAVKLSIDDFAKEHGL